MKPMIWLHCSADKKIVAFTESLKKKNFYSKLSDRDKRQSKSYRVSVRHVTRRNELPFFYYKPAKCVSQPAQSMILWQLILKIVLEFSVYSSTNFTTLDT